MIAGFEVHEAGHDGEHAAHVTPDIAPVHVWGVQTFAVRDEAVADYGRYRDTLAIFDAASAPATFDKWWMRYADNYCAKATP